MTNARDIMSPLDPVGAQETVEAATHKMDELHVRALPICGPSGNLATMQGMITDDDIAEKVSHGRDPAVMRVGELAHGDTGMIGADHPAEEALDTMAEHHIDRLPVVDGFRVVGVVDKVDVEQALPDSGTDLPAPPP